jgi:PAS domain S-box-containing protein
VKTEQPDFDELSLRYTRLFEAAQDGILLLNHPECVITDANPYITNLLGYSRDELVGGKLWENGLFLDKAKAKNAMETLLKEGYVRFDDIDLVHKNGSRLPAEFVCNTYPLDGIRVTQCNIRDVSARKKAETELSQEKARLANQIYETVNSLSNVIEARDPFTAGHQSRVTDLAVEIAKEMNLSPTLIDGLRFASQIHDIGKIAIPVEILTKPSALNPLEVAMLKSHVQAGYDILRPLTFPWPVAKIILQHHERLDSSGYPNAIGGDAICLEAKILAVADTVEAMSTNRPYRPAKGIDAALKEIQTNKGLLYDEGVVDACQAVFAQGYKFPRSKAIKYERL